MHFKSPTFCVPFSRQLVKADERPLETGPALGFFQQGSFLHAKGGPASFPLIAQSTWRHFGGDLVNKLIEIQLN